jgi:hypothetical protein
VMVNSHSDIVKTLTGSLANPYSTLTPHYPTQLQHVNAQGYAYSSTYNPLAVPSTSFNYVSSINNNTRPSRAAPVMQWYTSGKSKCTYLGCTFTGSANSVEIHMMDRHLIYPPGWHTRKHQADWDTDPSLKGCVKLIGMYAELGFHSTCVGSRFPSWARTYVSTHPKTSRRGSRSASAAGRQPRASQTRSVSLKKPLRMVAVRCNCTTWITPRSHGTNVSGLRLEMQRRRG